MRIGKKVKQVHILGCAAFHGPKPPGNCTVDHIAKYDGDFMRERSDNRACNLRWATKAEQSMNQKAHCVHSNGVPILARPVGSTDDWRSYTSATAASKDLGIDTSSISKVCDATKTTKQTAGGWVFRIDYSKLESQENLPAEERGPPDARFTVRVERWQLDPESGGSTWVSTRGRVQTKNTNGDDFSPMRTPRPREGEVYAIVSGDKVHLVVWRTFCANNIPTGTDSIDHWDQTKANNCLYNLRRATRSEQAFNRTLPSADDQIRARACARMEGWNNQGGGRVLLRSQSGGARTQRARRNDQILSGRHFTVRARGVEVQRLALCLGHIGRGHGQGRARSRARARGHCGVACGRSVVKNDSLLQNTSVCVYTRLKCVCAFDHICFSRRGRALGGVPLLNVERCPHLLKRQQRRHCCAEFLAQKSVVPRRRRCWEGEDGIAALSV